jgi:aspartate ammonia-lyase
LSFSKNTVWRRKRLSFFRKFDFLGESSLMESSSHQTSARALTSIKALGISSRKMHGLFAKEPTIAAKVYQNLAQIISRRMHSANHLLVNLGAQYISGRTRTEHDLLGDREVPAEAYYGVQTLRAMENFNITGTNISFYPVFVQALAMVKMAAAKANYDLGLLDSTMKDAIVLACDEIIKGKYHKTSR